MKIPFRLTAFAVTSIAISLFMSNCQSVAANPEEVGKVTWGRDYEGALSLSRATGKPIFLLFQEVPGCAGCKQFGREVLSDPSVRKSVEDDFIPLLIPNNSSGKDAEVLRRYDEPAWNYQVVRFLDSAGHDLIPRKDRVWDAPQLKARMALALEKSGRRLHRVAFSQSCFWEGEMRLGAIEGVTRTEAGFLGGREVTLVDYDPAKVALASLTQQAKSAGVGTGVFTDLGGYEKAPAPDQKRQLQGTPYAKLKLTPEQATKVNAFVRTAPERVAEFLEKP
jgi:Thioredoxin-like